MNDSKVYRILIIVLFISTVSCNQVVITPTQTPVPTKTPSPTETPAPTLQPEDSEHKVMVGEMERSYLLYIPAGLANNQPVPVVFVFHGSGGDPRSMRAGLGFNDIADNAGFIVVYPKGINGIWNPVTPSHELSTNVDDLGYVRQILLDLKKNVQIDPKRIYSTGFSLGAMFSFRLACEMSDIFAAIGPVSGAHLYNPCEPEHPVSVIQVHGLEDANVPYEGDPTIQDFLSTEEDIKFWTQLDGCDDYPLVENLLNESITHTAYTTCNAGSAVELFLIEKGTHAWPSKYIWDASQTIWEFFAAHPKP